MNEEGEQEDPADGNAVSSSSASAGSSVLGLSSEKIYEEFLRLFYSRMDGEISRLWQRSIFLATFLVLIFTGYGCALTKLLGGCDCCGIIDGCGAFPLNFVCVVIALLGVLFSALWIVMGKGSKAWQEKYERSLFVFLKKKADVALEDLKKYGVLHGFLQAIEEKKFSNSLLNAKAGAYSPSKINILIGQISFVFWLLVGIFHSLILVNLCGIVVAGIVGVVFLFLAFYLTRRLSKRCKSGVIQDKQDNPDGKNDEESKQKTN